MDFSQTESQISKRKRDELVASIEAGENDLFGFFSNSIFMGDSRVYGFWSYGWFPVERTFAEAGYTILNITDYLEEIEKLQPEYIILSYGMNDMGLQVGSDLGEDGYAQVYRDKIEAVLEKSPNSKIVINSIIPAAPSVVEANPKWGSWKDLNWQMKEMAEENGWIYVDNDALSPDGTADIYAEDGIHLQKSFYPVWAMNILETILDRDML